MVDAYASGNPPGLDTYYGRENDGWESVVLEKDVVSFK